MREVNAGSAGEVAAALLADQRRLIAAQIAQLGRQRFRDLTIAVFIALVIAGAFGFIWSASRAEGVVVQPFAMPPDLERRGLTGPVAAAQLLDKLTAMQAETRSARAASTYADNWGEDIKLEVPYAGVSFGELRRILRESLGSQTRLSGEVIRLGDDRLALTMRAGGLAARVEGNAADLDRLMSDGARAIYKATQPYRYNVWLSQSPGNAAERRAVLLELSRSSDLNERLWGFHGLSNDAKSPGERSAYHMRALRLKPNFLPVLGNLPYAARARGHEEDAYRLEQQAVAAYEAGQSDYDPRRAARYELSARAAMAASKGDNVGAARLEQEAIELPSDRTNDLLGPYAAAGRWALAHDFAAAKQVLADAGLLDPTTRAEIEREYGRQTSLAFYLANATGDAALEIHELDSLRAALTADLGRPEVGTQARSAIQDGLTELELPYAIAYARSGAAQKAAAAAAATPIDHDGGLRARGLAAAAAGRVQESEDWFKKAVARTPSLPAGHAVWAEARLMRGDLSGAIEQARFAHEKGPRWADPLRTWGQALLRQGDALAAASRFELAAERAPQWGAVYLDWAQALWGAKRFDEARSKLAAARKLALSTADRARLERMTIVANGSATR
ncbi:MAG: hypothetical protein ABIW30_02200 [Arenimonas sp.]